MPYVLAQARAKRLDESRRNDELRHVLTDRVAKSEQLLGCGVEIEDARVLVDREDRVERHDLDVTHPLDRTKPLARERAQSQRAHRRDRDERLHVDDTPEWANADRLRNDRGETRPRLASAAPRGPKRTPLQIKKGSSAYGALASGIQRSSKRAITRSTSASPTHTRMTASTPRARMRGLADFRPNVRITGPMITSLLR